MIYLFLARGFEEIEALTPVDLLRRAGVAVTTVGVGASVVTGSHGIPVQADTTLDKLPSDADFSGIILPGGLPGATNLEANERVLHFVRRAAHEGKLLAAICAAPSIPGHMGLLEGREATAYPGYETELHGARCNGAPVCCDGNIITARGAGVSVDFALALVAYCKGKEAARELARSIQCR